MNDSANSKRQGPMGASVGRWILGSEAPARRAFSFGGFLWGRTTIDRRLLEVAVLVTVRFWECNLDWLVHAKLAPENGVTQEVIDAIFDKRRPEKAPEDELVVY